MAASIVTSALFFTGCATTRRTEILTETASNRHEADSAAVTDAGVSRREAVLTEQEHQAVRKLLRTLEPVSASEARMGLKIQNLLDLPEGAGYHVKDGRASVNVERRGDSLEITGGCDSIARQCLYYEETAFRQRQRADSLEAEVYRLEAMLRHSLSAEVDVAREETVESKKPPNRAGLLALAFLAGVAAGAVIIIKIRKRK